VIVFLLTAEHAYTMQRVIGAREDIRVEVSTYRNLQRAGALPRATYVFTDLDRLSPSMLRAAAASYRRLRDAGLRVLNDPARMPSRLGLLRSLHEAGINRFNAYRAEERVTPARWPVFLRCEGSHEAPRSDLLPDAAAVDSGVPLPSLLVIEYAAEPVKPGLFRKLACFQIGEAGFAHLCVHDDQWAVKYGKKGIAGEDLYEDELRIVRDNPFGEKLRAVFRRAGIEYGRADFGLLGGEAQVYEINTNPDVKLFPKQAHPSPHRLEALRIYRENYLDALKAIDTPEGGSVRV
jgi:hypothetical protein